MMKLITSKNTGMGLLRVITGLLLAWHGLEVFDTELMNDYLAWESIKALPFSKAMVYLGKGGELVAGLLLAAGLLTRFAAAAGAIIMLFICFAVGNGRFWYEDQHPYLFAMLCTVFLVYGPGGLAFDKIIRKKENL